MALTINCYKCLFYVLLQTAFVWDATATIHHYHIQRSLLAESDMPETTIDPFSDSNRTLDLNVTNTVEDHHVYYNSSFYSDPNIAISYWIDLKLIPQEKIITHKMLSGSHRRAAGVTLSFDFPFYGHMLQNITIATGGFLYMGDQIHSWIAATQYIAPLMANFDPSLDESSIIQYYDNGTAFTVQWDKVLLQNRSKDEPFTFQTTLLQNGDIIFVYKEIPIPVLKISDERHPVKVGCSDAFVMERSTSIFRKKIIYEYHRVDQKNQKISNNTALYLTALQTCLKYNDCISCEKANIGFNCSWCQTHGKCSDGLNRYRQEWLQLKCEEVDTYSACPSIPTAIPTAPTKSVIVQNTTSAIKNMTTVPLVTTSSSSVTANMNSETTTVTFNPMPFTLSSNSDDKSTSSPFSDSSKAYQEGYTTRQDAGIGTGGIFAIVLVITLALGIGVWTFYAYKNPQSSSGQFLIKYRPSQWHWKSEESRYSASVHM